jgi:hypothetical protein
MSTSFFFGAREVLGVGLYRARQGKTGSDQQGKSRMQPMVPRDLVDVFNRIALVLGFFSFWFAAPEFIGEERLRK